MTSQQISLSSEHVERDELACTPQLHQCPRFDLPDTFSAQVVTLGDCVERLWNSVESESSPNDGAFTGRETAQKPVERVTHLFAYRFCFGV
ncbi:MAG TPA: hypothetical protein VKW09_00020 [bacterium]|nr:hypothetical protein [bacterium]